MINSSLKKLFTNNFFYKFWLCHLSIILSPLFITFFSLINSSSIRGPHEYYLSNKLGEVPGSLLLIAIFIFILLRTFVFGKKLAFLYSNFLFNLLLYCIFILIISYQQIYSFSFIFGFIFLSILIYICLINHKINLVSQKVLASIKCSIQANIITTIFFLFCGIIFISVHWLNTRIGYFSLHLSEYTLIPYFWDLHNESFFNYFPRHGLQEVLLGKILLKLNFDIYQVGYLGEFLIKTATILDMMAIVYWLKKYRLDLTSTIILFTIVLFYFLITWQVGTHVFLLTLPFFFYEKSVNLNIYLRTFLLALINVSIFFLRWDYGLFAMIASSIIFIIDNKNFKLISFYTLSLTLFLQIYLQLLNSNFLEFINFMWVLKNNNAVWGWPVIFSQPGTPYILMNFFITAYLVFILYKNRASIHEEYSLIFLMLLSLFNILVLCGRSDGHVYFTGILFTLIPIFLIFYRNQLFFDHGRITRLGIFILLIPLFIMLSDYTVRNNYKHSLNFFKAFNTYKSFPSSNQIWPHSIETKNKIFDLANNPLFKNKISFIPINPFEYVIFDTKPIGHFSDLYHASQTKSLHDIKEIFDISEIVILDESHAIDGYPLRERFHEAFQWLDKNFTLIFNDSDKIKIYQKRVLDGKLLK